MKVDVVTSKKLFQQDVQYEIPVFQREYVWTLEDQWEGLWEDIQDTAEDYLKHLDEVDNRAQAQQRTRKHFMGAVVLQQKLEAIAETQKCLVIDGQQRLTTVQLLLNFWRVLLDCAQPKTDLHSGWGPVKANYISSPQGPGISLRYNLANAFTSVVVYIDKGSDEESWNDRVFDYLSSCQSKIEDAFGGGLTWEEKTEGVRSRRFLFVLDVGGLDHEDRWQEIAEATVDAMIRLEESVRPHLSEALRFANE